MKMHRLVLPALLAVFTGTTFADDCSTTIDSNDAMQFSKKSITVSSSCEEFTLNLTHSGKLPKKAMGHNWVLVEASDVGPVASGGMKAGLENNYVKPGDERVIAFTDIIGGGEKTSVSFAVNQLSGEESYTFFCSFPGHSGIMKGSLSVAP